MALDIVVVNSEIYSMNIVIEQEMHLIQPFYKAVK